MLAMRKFVIRSRDRITWNRVVTVPMGFSMGKSALRLHGVTAPPVVWTKEGAENIPWAWRRDASSAGVPDVLCWFWMVSYGWMASSGVGWVGTFIARRLRAMAFWSPEMNSGDWNAVPQFTVLVLVPSSLWVVGVGDSVVMISSETIDKTWNSEICGVLELVCDSKSSNNAVSDAR